MKHDDDNEKQKAVSSKKITTEEMNKSAASLSEDGSAVSKRSKSETANASKTKKIKTHKKLQRWDDMLSADERAVYEERSRRLAVGDQKLEKSSEQVTFIRFRLGKSELYGLPYGQIKEILYAGGLTSVPTTPDFIAGVINRSGEMLTVLDLRIFFRTEQAENAEDARIIVVEGNDLTVGLLVDEIEGNDDYDPSQLSAPLPSEGVSNIRYVKGIYKGNVTIIDLDALLSDQAIRVGWV